MLIAIHATNLHKLLLSPALLRNLWTVLPSAGRTGVLLCFGDLLFEGWSIGMLNRMQLRRGF